jgi:hypothetical protein
MCHGACANPDLEHHRQNVVTQVVRCEDTLCWAGGPFALHSSVQCVILLPFPLQFQMHSNLKHHLQAVVFQVVRCEGTVCRAGGPFAMHSSILSMILFPSRAQDQSRRQTRRHKIHMRTRLSCSTRI